MLVELDKIIDVINNSGWNKNTKIRYAYLELGKIVHKDVFFFYTIQNNLLTQEKNKLQYSIDEVDRIMNMDDLFDYKVICKTSADMLGYIFGKCNIEYEIRRTIDKDIYLSEEKSVEIYHYFIAVKGDNDKIYALTLNPDLPNIQLGKRTLHFGNNIPYMVKKDRKDEQGNVVKDENGDIVKDLVQNYEGEEIHFTRMSENELENIDAELGYLREIFPPGVKKENVGYVDIYFELIRRAYKKDGLYRCDEEYKNLMIYKTQFYRDLCILCNEETNLRNIFPESLFSNRTSDNDLYLDFNPLFKSKEEWNNIKCFIFGSVVFNIASVYNIDGVVDKFKQYYELFDKRDYKQFSKLFSSDFFKTGVNPEMINKMGPLNPLAVVRKMNYLFSAIDKFMENENKSKDVLLKFKNDFMECIGIIGGIFIEKNLLFNGIDSSNEYIANKIIMAFTKIFDIGYKTEFNDLYFGEQIVIIKEILDAIFEDLTVDKNIPGYDDTKSAIRNRVLTTVIFDKKTNKPYYLLCPRKITTSSMISTEYLPIIYDLKENYLITNLSIINIWNNFYIIKDSYVKLMLEDIEEKGKKI